MTTRETSFWESDHPGNDCKPNQPDFITPLNWIQIELST